MVPEDKQQKIARQLGEKIIGEGNAPSQKGRPILPNQWSEPSGGVPRNRPATSDSSRLKRARLGPIFDPILACLTVNTVLVAGDGDTAELVQYCVYVFLQ